MYLYTCVEIQRNIGRLKNRKAPGVCGEMLKAGGDIVVEWMHKIQRGEVAKCLVIGGKH